MHFKKPIEHLILLCDVDGVVRDNTESEADPHIIQAIKKIIATNSADAAFISGTPVVQPDVEIWRRCNTTLDKALGKALKKEIIDQKVTLFGCLGGQKMKHDGSIETLAAFTLETSFELSKILIQVFLEEVIADGSPSQISFARNLQPKVKNLRLHHKQQLPDITAEEFKDVVLEIRTHLDPEFRLISYGSFSETQSSNPPWNIERSKDKLKKILNTHVLFKDIAEDEKIIAGGLAHRHGKGFNFLLICKTNKGPTSKKHIQEKIEKYPNAVIVTIGDSQVDYPMHELAHYAFHVGKEQVWKDHPLEHCKLVTDEFGKDSQHVTGTLKVLNLILNNFFIKVL